MPIGTLPRLPSPTGPSPLHAASNRRPDPRAPLGASMHSIGNVPQLQLGRVSDLIKLFQQASINQKQGGSPSPLPEAATPIRVRSPSASSMSSMSSGSSITSGSSGSSVWSVSSSENSSGYGSRAPSECSETPSLSGLLRSALDEHLAGRTHTVGAENDFNETYSTEEHIAMAQRFSDEDEQIARANRAFEARQLGLAAPTRAEQEFNAVRAQLMDVLNRSDETHL
jgi:hypothetical protein